MSGALDPVFLVATVASVTQNDFAQWGWSGGSGGDGGSGGSGGYGGGDDHDMECKERKKCIEAIKKCEDDNQAGNSGNVNPKQYSDCVLAVLYSDKCDG